MKCFFIFIFSILTLICSNASTSNSNHTAKSILVNQLYKAISSESNVFYEPSTNLPVPQIGKYFVENTLFLVHHPQNVSRAIYGYLPCNCTTISCSCCVDIRINSFNVKQHSCIKLRTGTEGDLNGLEAVLEFNQRELLTQKLSSAKNTMGFPFCVPIPNFPILSVCVLFTNVSREGRNINACIYFDLRITTASEALWTLRFTCVSFGLDGISFSRPPIYPPMQPDVLPVQPDPQPQLYPYQLMPLNSIADPSPICIPLPNFPFISGCLHFYRIVAENGMLKGCIKLELRITATDIILWETKFSCFRIGMNGITFNRPHKKKEEKPGKQSSAGKPVEVRPINKS